MTNLRLKASAQRQLRYFLRKKKFLKPEDVDAGLTTFSEQVGPMNGAKLVARAWADPEFKQRLLSNATEVVEEYGFEGGQVDRLVVKECTDRVHHVVVCTLCSCYPWAVLGFTAQLVQGPRLSLQGCKRTEKGSERNGVERT